MTKFLHVVSFDVPYPPNYGGVIDVYYKILELNKLGVEIYLHTYISKGAEKQQKLNELCKEVFYYNKETKIIDFFSTIPFRVKSRSNFSLIKNLQTIKAPILFDGLHTTFPVIKHNFKNTYLRAHNIEHTYFEGLAKSETNIFKKIIYQLEAFKLKKFEKYSEKTNGIFAISPFEFDYFKQNFKTNTHYIPVFHKANFSQKSSSDPDYLLYHGDLRISDNIKSALFFIDTYKNTEYKLIIAKHILANKKITEDTGLEDACSLANNKTEFLKQTEKLFNTNFTDEDLKKRKRLLKQFNPIKSAQKIIDIIYSN
jgi:glycosyltransferase involved in cell wall biosynthesis